MILDKQVSRLNQSYHEIKEYQSAAVTIDKADIDLFEISADVDVKSAINITEMVTSTSADLASSGLKFRVMIQEPGETTWKKCFPYVDLSKGVDQSFSINPNIQIAKGNKWKVQAMVSAGSIDLKVDRVFIVRYE